MDSVTQSHRSLTLAAWCLVVIGWGGLLTLVFVAPLKPVPGVYPPVPGAGARWLFFWLFVMGLTGAAVPFARYLNRRFAAGATPAGVILRQALWVALYCSTCAWLQMNHILTIALALLLAASLGAIEWFLRLRERIRWTSPETS